ncbi:MAG: hypothetical protein H6983_11315 [Ectothiorhodospiraceae bacterium]|nr:hypothetical protein [Chromatiales bacterium]MCP5154749.1 hypothetical protein [Ectothiorhodospiraceae bacterium]
MGYYDDDVAEPPEGGLSVVQQGFALGVRLLGLMVLLLGIWVGAKVVLEAWALYQEPARIERFARAVEAGSNLDRMFASLADAAVGGGDAEGAGAGQATAEGAAASRPSRASADALRLSYFVAWIVALALMLVVGMLAMSAIATGGQLALYDLQANRISRRVVREVRAMRRG